MKEKPTAFASFLAVFGLTSMLLLSSCASLQLVSQRPAPGASVDATSGATSEAPATDAAGTMQKKAATDADAVSAATS